MAEDRWVFGITGDWSTAALDLGGFSTVQFAKGAGCRFMAAWVKEEEKAPENRQREEERSERAGHG